MNDEVTIDFYKRRNRGDIIQNAMTIVEQKTDQVPVYIDRDWTIERYLSCSGVYVWRPFVKSEYFGTWPFESFCSSNGLPGYLSLPSVTAAEIQSAQNIAVTKAWSNIDRSEILALVCAAEGKKTLGTIINTLKRAQKITRKVRRLELSRLKELRSWRPVGKDIRKEFKRWKSRVDDLSDAYLEARYGLRPLFYDVRGALALTKESSKDRFTFRGTEEVVKESSATQNYNFSYYSSLCPYAKAVTAYDRTSSVAVKARAGVLTSIDRLTMTERTGTNLIVQSVWELVPYSFIVDWFANVGETLGAWANKVRLGSNALTSWVTVEKIETQTRTFGQTVYTLTPSTYYRVMPASSKATVTGSISKVVRTVQRVPNPPCMVMPEIRINLDPAKLLDLALIGRNLKNHSRFFKALYR
jgi:hypothetical protein